MDLLKKISRKITQMELENYYKKLKIEKIITYNSYYIHYPTLHFQNGCTVSLAKGVFLKERLRRLRRMPHPHRSNIVLQDHALSC